MCRPYLDSDVNTFKTKHLANSWDNLNNGWVFKGIEGLL